MITATVIFGNSNSYEISLPENLYMGSLMGIISIPINKKPTNILYIICNGQLVTDFSKTLGSYGIVNNKCNIHMILKSRKLKYPDSDCVLSTRNRVWIEHNSTATGTDNIVNASIPSAGTSTGANPLLSFMNSLGMNLSDLQDVPVVLTSDQFSDIVQDGMPDVAVDDIECVVCRTDITHDQCVRLPCNHILHRDCANEWLLGQSVRCPTCNRDVRD